MFEAARAAESAILLSSARDVLETMFFEELLEFGGPPPQAALLVAARVAFSGSPSGAFLLWVSAPAASRLAAGFLGAEEETAADKAGDVVRELANMICGSVLSRLAPDGAFSLEAPELTDRPPSVDAVWAELDEGSFVALALEPEGTR